MEKRHSVKVTVHESGHVSEKPIGEVQEVRMDPLGTKVVTETRTHFFPADQYEKVETEWVDKQTANQLLEEIEA